MSRLMRTERNELRLEDTPVIVMGDSQAHLKRILYPLTDRGIQLRFPAFMINYRSSS